MSVSTPIVRETATVFVSHTVDGTVRRRTPVDRRRLATTVEHTQVDRRVWQAVRDELVLRENERLLIVSTEVVRTVYR